MSLFQYDHHPHVEARREQGPVMSRDHVPGASRINQWLAVKITSGIGTMWCAYIFAIIALISLPAALSTHNVITIVSWIAQTFLQLVLLSIIIVGQNILAQASDQRAEQTYQDAEAILHEAQQIQSHLMEQDKILSDALARLNGARTR